VLPFLNHGGSADDEQFADGLTEEIITDLARVKALRVLSRTSSMQLKGTTRTVSELGRELKVRYALSGSVRRAGNSLRITAELIDAATDSPKWAERFSGTMDDVFDVQERVAREIVKALGVTLSASEEKGLADRPIKDARAYEIYLRAQALVRRYGSSLEQVEALLARAIAIEGATPPLRALRAYMWVTQMRAGMATGPEALDRAEAEARALIEVAPDAAYGYALLGFIGYERGDQSATVRYLTQALERNPSDADALFFKGIALGGAGQIEAAIEVGRQFVASDPLSPMAGVLLNSSHWFAGQPEVGLQEHESGLVLDPENPIIHWSLGYTYALLGRRDDARARAEWMQARVPTMPYTVQLVALVSGLEGKGDEGRRVLQPMEGMAYDGHITFHLAESWAVVGDSARALTLLGQAIDRGFYPAEYIATFCPFFASLRDTPEFARLVARARERVKAFAA
jgi:TolB-like protein/Flp pilus assembly protein TadD